MSTLKVNTIQHSNGTNAMTIDSSGNAAFSGVVTGTPLGNRNLIINGDMRIDQRNAGSATTYNINNAYTLDRWKGSSFTADATIQQVTDAPSTFSHSMKYTVVSAITPGTGNTEVIAQGIEGQNVSHLSWGTSNAKTITISFWVKSSLTGSFCVSISNSSNPRAIATASRSYVTTYTISSANTWEYKTITITGDTSGTWVTNSGSGIAIQFPFAVGSDYSTSNINTWQSGTYAWISGTQYITETASATWQVTGVQLEVGENATEFEHRPYDMELQRCQRYYLQYDYTGFYETIFMPTYIGSASSQNIIIYFPVEMRSSPNISHNGVGNFRVNVVSGAQDEVCNSITASNISKFKTRLTFEKATANMTAGQVGYINTQENNDASIYISAEL